ncbi:bacillithiol biosynthesis deacetylase BshB2 [Alkalihalobacterium bogoriense]|uniref:bacillithiol biosynthesis deacetylase BshB2 n=1 Tax=Alkalihalobacterium bogoriense TaxID=246272 RepID=UPI00047BF56F|nr:bacillithiol biosynthesis deacetylase BshB2 [Alkalihalobacterium bogoriense]
MERHVLVILPHPDDESFAAAGTILTHKKNGTPVTYFCLTLGEMGRNFGNPPIATRETLPSIRKKELEEACRILGVDNLKLLGLHDKMVEFEDFDKLSKQLAGMIAEVNPSLIITFYPGLSIHPDHDACGEVVIKAVQQIPKDKRPVVHAVAITNNCEEIIGKPDVVHDIDEYLPIKLEALKAHATQMQEVVAVTEQKLKEGRSPSAAWLRYERFWVYSV